MEKCVSAKTELPPSSRTANNFVFIASYSFQPVTLHAAFHRYSAEMYRGLTFFMAVVHHKLVLFGRKDTGRILDKFSTSRWNDKARTECDFRLLEGGRTPCNGNYDSLPILAGGPG